MWDFVCRHLTAKGIYKPSFGTQVGLYQGLPSHLSFSSTQIFPSMQRRVQAFGSLAVAHVPSSGVTKHVKKCTKCKCVLACRKSEDKIIITIALSTLHGRVGSFPTSYSGGPGFWNSNLIQTNLVDVHTGFPQSFKIYLQLMPDIDYTSWFLQRF
jgi:hypothetical protein